MAVRIEDRERWYKLQEVSSRLAQKHGCLARPILHAKEWLQQLENNQVDRIRRNEILVVWTVAGAELIRHELRDHIPSERVFAAAPRFRYPRRTTDPQDIPPPRGQQREAREE